MRDHPGLVVDQFRGTFDRGEDDTTPAGFFLSSLNLEFVKDGVRTRSGIELDDLAAPIPLGLKVVRQEIYEKLGEAQRLLILDDTGRIWDSVTGLVILIIPTMTDFSVTVMFDRAYISPHNGVTGLPGEKVYIYTGSGSARPAAGTGPGPTPAMIAADSALSGNCEKDYHAFAVAFESSSGFHSPLGAFVGFVPVGDKKVSLTNIPLGPAGTVARVLFATKVILEPSGIFDQYTFYFIPLGRIPDNTSTTKDVDFFDADLQDDASYLLEQLSEIPAGVGIGQYKSRLVVWGEDANSAIVRLSKPGEPEAHNGISGYLTVYPGVGGGVKNCAEYRNQLLLFKSFRSYSTQDNDNDPAFWDVGEVDGSVGTECHGVGQILNIGTNVEDRLFISSRSGLRLFTGSFTEDGVTTYNVDDIWGRITKTAFNNVEVSVDADNARIYVTVPLDGATKPNYILYGDYSEGLTEDSIRWCLWSFPVNPTSIVIALINGEPILKIGSFASYVSKLTDGLRLDRGQKINWFCKFPLFPVGGVDDQVQHITGIMVRARGAGDLEIRAEGLDGVDSIQAQSLVLATNPGRPLFRGFNFTSERCSVTLTGASVNGYIIMTKFTLYMSPLWESRPVLG
jgi:hypothetical protein